MVEGPGATRNAEKARKCIGLTNDNAQKLDRVLSVGKEVFLLFEDGSGVRLHFGMNGSLQLGSVGHHDKRKKDFLSWTMIFSDEQSSHQISCYSTTVTELRSTQSAINKWERLHRLDICSPPISFDPAAVLQAMKTRPNCMLSDVLLDQNRYPGVGNIIKVEGLHRAQLHPKKKIKDCSEADLKRVIHKCRSYAYDWYRHGGAPRKLVYNQTSCQTCHEMTVRIEKMGNDLQRTTFWCTSCQSKDASKDPRLIAGPTILGDSQVVNQNPTPTSINPYDRSDNVCSCPRHGSQFTRLRRVRKSSVNQGRIFVLCSKCPSFFQWADAHFQCPQKACRKRTRILRISKTAHSGGKWFLSCPSCRDFAWADKTDLKPLQAKLTPLL